MLLPKAIVFTFFLSAAALLAAPDTSDAPVTIHDDGAVFTLTNGYLTAQINKTTGDMTSLKFHGLEMMGYVSGHHAGYWEQNPARAAHLTATLTIDPAKNGGARGEVSINGIAGGRSLNGGDQPGGSMLCDLEIRYALGRGEHGLYTYAIFTHEPDYGQTQIGESRYGVKLNAKVFDWLSIDAQRNGLMPTGYDWDQGSPLNMKEARRLTTGIYTGRAEHKYDYSADQFDIPAFGWSSTKEHIGLYFINPSMEYLSDGATHVELTGHLDDGAGGDPTLLDYWRGTHYGSSILPLAAGEKWSKVVGPIFIYLNTGANPNAMYHDALAQAGREAAKWPYDWVQGVDYPHREDRGTVSGQLVLHDPQAATSRLPHLLVGLAYPDAPPPATEAAPPVRGRRFGPSRMTWQNDAKHYEFWVRGSADGKFTIPKVRPGTYELHAIADGVLGEYAKADITVAAGQKLDLGKLSWDPVRYGRQLWDIGIPNRNASEFFKGNDHWHWGMYLDYAKLFPNDVHYTVGKSDYRKDWFFEEVPHAEQDDGTGRSRGRSTTWTIEFPLRQAPHGRATLRLALSGVSTRSIAIAVNDKPAGSADGLAYNATINRDGIQGTWAEKDIRFDASLMKAGENTLTLTIPTGSLTSGIVYDYIRLELDETAQPASSN
ncbi:MAG TPA: polysaccharide lyase family protein [Bryobacteraceae bacterium]|nr:polysaccharide lyase family protein [Bryobacteraceae bacterium]